MKRYIATKVVPNFHSKTNKSLIYQAVFASGSSGVDRSSLASALGIETTRVSFFLSELRRDGYVVVLGDPNAAVAPTMNADEAAFVAMLGLENALIARAKELKTVTPEMNKAFVRYQKLKSVALGQPSTNASSSQVERQKNEAQVGLRMALMELVKAVF